MPQPSPKLIGINLPYKHKLNTLFEFFVFVGSFAQSLHITNITTIPFLPDNKIATGYSGLKLMIRIEAANLYQSCEWLKDESFFGVIFSRNNDVTSCDNFENIHNFSCVEEKQVVTAAITKVSLVDMEDSGNYRVQCFNYDLMDFIIAQLNIMVKSNHLL